MTLKEFMTKKEMIVFLKENLKVHVKRVNSYYGHGGPQDGEDYKGDVCVELYLGGEMISASTEY